MVQRISTSSRWNNSSFYWFRSNIWNSYYWAYYSNYLVIHYLVLWNASTVIWQQRILCFQLTINLPLKLSKTKNCQQRKSCFLFYFGESCLGILRWLCNFVAMLHNSCKTLAPAESLLDFCRSLSLLSPVRMPLPVMVSLVKSPVLNLCFQVRLATNCLF